MFIFWFPLTFQSCSKMDNIGKRVYIKVPLWYFFDFVIYQKFHYKMSDINVVQYLWNFKTVKRNKKINNLKSLTLENKNWGNNQVSRRFGRYSFYQIMFLSSGPSFVIRHNSTFERIIVLKIDWLTLTNFQVTTFYQLAWAL